MANFLNSIDCLSTTASFVTGGHHPIVQTPSGLLYIFGVEVVLLNLYYYKSVDNGKTWSKVLIDNSSTHSHLSVWYDRWTSNTGDLIHIAYSDTTEDDVVYRNLDTTNDSLSSPVNVFTGLSTALGGSISLTKSRGGNLYVFFDMDAGTETGFYRSVDSGANWTVRASPFEATLDQSILMPGWAADNQDLILFFWDASADEISKKLYDDSADSWSEISIAGSMVERAQSIDHPHWAVSVDLTNSENILVAWSAVDTAGADLRCWRVTEAATTEVTNVVLNSTDDQGFAALSILDNGTWYVYYGGNANGSQLFPDFLSLNYKVSTDRGVTWSAQTPLISGPMSIKSMMTAPRVFNTEEILAVMGPPEAFNSGILFYVVSVTSGGTSVFS